MQVDFDLDVSVAQRKLRSISRAADRAIATAVNRTIRDAQRKTVDDINKRVKLKKSDIRNKKRLGIVKATAARPSGAVVAYKKGMTLSGYSNGSFTTGYRSRVAKGRKGPGRTRIGARATVKLFRSRDVLVGKAFRIRLRNTNIDALVIRKKNANGRDRLQKLFGLSVHQLAKGETFDAIARPVERVLSRELTMAFKKVIQ